MLLDNKVSQHEIIHDNKKAQVMLITLLVMVILGIMIAGIVIVLRRDVEQTVSNVKFEQLLNSAEGNLQEMVSQYGDTSLSLSTLPSKYTTCSASTVGVEYTCIFTNDTFTSIETTTEVVIEDSKDITDFAVEKDRTLAVNVEDYSGLVIVNWTNGIAMEVTIFYEDSTGKIQISKGVYDNGTGVFQNPIQNPRPFNSTGIDTFTINIGAWSFSNRPLLMLLTPRSKSTLASTEITVIGNAPSTYPPQMRTFTSSSYDPQDGVSPVAKVRTQIPITSQVDSIFDYALLSNDDIGL